MNKPPANLVIIAISIVAVTAGIIISSFMLSRFMLKIQHSTEKSISVKGVAEKMITSDLAAFNCSISVKGNTRAEGYAAVEKASQVLCAKLDSLGFVADMREDMQAVRTYHGTKLESVCDLSAKYFDDVTYLLAEAIRQG